MNSSEIFSKLYDNINGNAINKAARVVSGLSEAVLANMMYGETTFETIEKIANNSEVLKKIEDGGSFLDIGSGIGNVVIGMSLVSDFVKLSGVEIVPGTYAESLKKLDELSKIDRERAGRISFFNQNALDFELENYDVIFANHPLKLESPIRPQLLRRFEKAKIGTIFISVIGKIESDSMVRFLQEKMKFSWGEATLRMYKKVK